MGPDMEFYRGRRVFVTGHTGFKGAWLCRLLACTGAEVTGFALEPPTKPSLYEIAEIGRDVRSVIGDVRDLAALRAAFDAARPEVVLHLAAQPIVREGYVHPAYTYETNVMGTVNVLECARGCDSVRSVLIVTTDKVYLNREWDWGYREEDALDGFDPYSNSKSCAELVTRTYRRSFFGDGRVAVSTARAGNVIGGGDFAENRLLPDCVRAAQRGEAIVVRNPRSVRPFQHVLEPLYAYLMIAARQCADGGLAGSYNVGPEDGDCLEAGALVDLFIKKWDGGLRRVDRPDGGPHEARLLKLDCSRLRNAFGWRPRWNIETAVAATVEWSRCWLDGGDARACMDRQIDRFLKG